MSTNHHNQKDESMSTITCTDPRKRGYTHRNGQWVCRACGLGFEPHETPEETLARLEKEARRVDDSFTISI
jgi:rubrerythrin